MIEVKILLVAEALEAQKDCNEKPVPQDTPKPL
jgi:hypothetical protein